jgi:hypothetical protein
MSRVLKIATGAKRTYRVKSRVKTVRALTLQLQNLPITTGVQQINRMLVWILTDDDRTRSHGTGS